MVLVCVELGLRMGFEGGVVVDCFFPLCLFFLFFFFNDTSTTEIYTLSLHDALPISAKSPGQYRTVRKHRKHKYIPSLSDMLSKNCQVASLLSLVATYVT